MRPPNVVHGATNYVHFPELASYVGIVHVKNIETWRYTQVWVALDASTFEICAGGPTSSGWTRCSAGTSTRTSRSVWGSSAAAASCTSRSHSTTSAWCCSRSTTRSSSCRARCAKFKMAPTSSGTFRARTRISRRRPTCIPRDRGAVRQKYVRATGAVSCYTRNCRRPSKNSRRTRRSMSAVSAGAGRNRSSCPPPRTAAGRARTRRWSRTARPLLYCGIFCSNAALIIAACDSRLVRSATSSLVVFSRNTMLLPSASCSTVEFISAASTLSSTHM